MARIYAGILGPLAFLTTLSRGVLHDGATDSILFSAWCALLAFSAVGYVVGRIAEQTVEESVRRRVAVELAAQEAQQAMQVADAG